MRREPGQGKGRTERGGKSGLGVNARAEKQKGKRRSKGTGSGGGNQDWELGRVEVEIGVSCPGVQCMGWGRAGRTEPGTAGTAGGGEVSREMGGSFFMVPKSEMGQYSISFPCSILLCPDSVITKTFEACPCWKDPCLAALSARGCSLAHVQSSRWESRAPRSLCCFHIITPFPSSFSDQ